MKKAKLLAIAAVPGAGPGGGAAKRPGKSLFLSG
jgi:hypothetical protein